VVDKTVEAQQVVLADDDNLGALPRGYLLGRYELLKVLGQGGFGITYHARDSRLEREVAIKEYLPVTLAIRHGGTQVMPRTTHAATDFLWGRERFLAEARTLARVQDVPAVVRVHDFLEANGTAYLVMEFKRGETLEARLKREGRLPQTAIEKLLYPLLDGLERLHATGFVHRDIKPSNLVIDDDGNPTLLDFGAARAEMASRTQAATAIWTPGFAAVEQFMSDKQGPFTDIYALAATLYYCVAGSPPPSALDRLLQDRLAPASRIGNQRYSPALLTGIDAGLGLKAPDRPQSIIAWRMIFATGMVPPKTAASEETSLGRQGDTLALEDTATPLWKPLPDTTAKPEPPPAAAAPAAPPTPHPRQTSRWSPMLTGSVGALAMLIIAGGLFAGYVFTTSPPQSGVPWAPLPPATPAPTDVDLKRSADAARHAQEEQAAAAVRKAEQERLAAEAARKAEQERLAAEAARKAEQDRIAAEAARKAEQERLAAEAARKAEQERLAAEAARKAEQERRAAEATRRVEQERAAAEAARKAAEQERAAAEAARRAEQERAAAEAARKAEQERIAADLARKAEQERQAWDVVNKQDLAALRRFADSNPDHPRSAEARQYLAAVGRNDAPALRSFAVTSPSSALAAPARQRADRLDGEAREWPQAQNSGSQALTQFLQRYPDLRYAGEARQRLAQLERQAWQQLQSDATEEKLQQFIAEFPNGQYAREARQALQERRAERGDQAAVRPTKPGPDSDRAYDPTANLPRQAINLGSVPDGNMRRQPGSPPQDNRGMPLFTVRIDQQLHLAGDRSQLVASITNHSNRVFDPIVDCTFFVGATRVAFIRFNPRGVQPGEVVTATIVGPQAPIYATEARCVPIGPFQLPN